MVTKSIQLQAITPAEQSIGRFARRKLCSLSTWEQWHDGQHEQLNHFQDLKMHGEPVRKPPGAVVVRPHLQCSIKRDGTRRSRNCCDGSPRSAPLVLGIASTHSSCVEQPVQQLFFALAAREKCRPKLMQTGVNTISRRNWTAFWFFQSSMPFRPTPNLVNSGKSTSLLPHNHHNLASRAPHMIVPHDRPLSRLPKCSCCAKLTTLLLLVPMKTSPSISMIRSVNDCNCRLKQCPHSST